MSVRTYFGILYCITQLPKNIDKTFDAVIVEFIIDLV